MEDLEFTFPIDLTSFMRKIKKTIILEALEQAEWKIYQACELLGISRITLQIYIRRDPELSEIYGKNHLERYPDKTHYKKGNTYK